jgi:hypothetical protein
MKPVQRSSLQHVDPKKIKMLHLAAGENGT